MQSIVIALALGSAAAYVTPVQTSARSVSVHETKADLEVLAKELNPVRTPGASRDDA